MKLVPVSVKLKLAPPTVAEEGATPLSVGTFETCPTTNVAEFDVPLLLGFCTVMLATPPLATRAEETVAVNWVELVKFVIRNEPFQSTVAPAENPDPFTVSVNPELPGAMPAGLSEEILGPLLTPMVKVEAPVATPLVVTVTLAVPGLVTKLAGTMAVNWVLLTNVVDKLAPLHATDEVFKKPVPLTVSVKEGPPGAAKFGFRLVMVDVPFVPVNAKKNGEGAPKPDDQQGVVPLLQDGP